MGTHSRKEVINIRLCGIFVLAGELSILMKGSDGIMKSGGIDAITINEKNILSHTVEPLLDWYRDHKRILPWREDPVPYHVWISEIMLQQTRVEAVKEYYRRFLDELPDIASLAAVKEDRLLKLWEGLGYYNRARNLKKAAVMIMEMYQGSMPDSYDELLKLPGIGAYTAGAVASIAFGKDVPAVDGNVLRVITRVTGDTSDISDESVRKRIAEDLSEILPKGQSGTFNQALMDLGAMICIPNGQPKCDPCPWKELCAARQKNLTDTIPYKPPKKQRTAEKKTVLVIRLKGGVLLHKRPAKGLLAGLYELPSMEGYCGKKEALDYVRGLGFSPIYIESLPLAKHIFTHKEWLMKAYLVRADELSERKDITKRDSRWCLAAPEEVERGYPIPSAFSAYERYIRGKEYGEGRN